MTVKYEAPDLEALHAEVLALRLIVELLLAKELASSAGIDAAVDDLLEGSPDDLPMRLDANGVEGFMREHLVRVDRSLRNLRGDAQKGSLRFARGRRRRGR